MAKAGAITLDGTTIRDASTRVTLTPDFQSRMKVAGKPLDPLEGMVILLNKPLGVTCSHKDTGDLVYELLPPRWRRRKPMVSTIGRLDKETSGLLLLTDDGDLLHRVISPKRGHTRTYHARLARPLRGDEGEIFATGTLLLEGETTPLAPATLQVLSETEAKLTLTEGRYHQVRRMFAAVGNHVNVLHRESLGGLSLPYDLPPGAWRLLQPEKIAKIFDTGS